MQLQFRDVFAGLALRRRKPQRQRLIDRFAVLRVAHARQRHFARVRNTAGQSLKCSARLRTRNANDGNCRRRPARGQGKNGGTIDHAAGLPSIEVALRVLRATCYGASMSTQPSTQPATAGGRHNRLAEETSPYLLQHQANPVAWWAWGPDALAEAKRANKPILLSVGYAACHWCHVMAHESFEDEATARVMNELFVNIKVDREERPDIDQIYMAALHHLGEHGGWPLTMFLTPAGEPVWGGTYFPKESRYGRPAFTAVCRELARVFREEPERIVKNRDALMQRLLTGARAERPVTIGLAGLDDGATQLGRMIDQAHGGLRGAPKFPQSTMLENLWRAGLRRGENRFFDLVELSLDHMCRGGIYDHLGGGFSRYSVDERWLV